LKRELRIKKTGMKIMQRRNDIAKILLIGSGLWPAALASADGPDIKVVDHSRFCVKHGAQDDAVSTRGQRGEVASMTFADAGDGRWTLQGYPPLVDTRNGTVYEQATFTGKWLSKVRLRSFRRDYELSIEHKFNEQGKLTETVGGIRQGTEWYAEASLYPDGKGGVKQPEVTYSHVQGGHAIVQPDDGRYYTPMLMTARLYKTKDEIPCAGLLMEAEKMNATQK
jgi:hypothetical protein